MSSTSLGPAISFFFLCSFHFLFTNSFLVTKLYYGEEQGKEKGHMTGGDDGGMTKATWHPARVDRGCYDDKDAQMTRQRGQRPTSPPPQSQP
jgi:hypothetical protein